MGNRRERTAWTGSRLWRTCILFVNKNTEFYDKFKTLFINSPWLQEASEEIGLVARTLLVVRLVQPRSVKVPQ